MSVAARSSVGQRRRLQPRRWLKRRPALFAATAAASLQAATAQVVGGDLEFTCPYLHSEACFTPDKQHFLDLWAKRLKCWLCTDIMTELSELAIGIIKEMTQLDIATTPDRGLQLTRGWFDTCIPVYLIAIFMTTRGSVLQPWVLYELGLNVILTCGYEDAEFFRHFGITPAQISYVLGLIGQPYDLTPQLVGLQQPERAVRLLAAPQGQDGGSLQLRTWDRPLVIDVGMGLGADSRYYLRQGFRVVAVEANPLAIEAALADPGTAPYLLSGQLTVLNAAIAGPENNATQTSFWVIPQRPEQSKALAWVAQDGGEEVFVRTVRCADLLRVYGEVAYMKVDVEFNTIDCLESLRHEFDARRRAGDTSSWSPPRLLSLEVEAADLVKPFYAHLVALGYSYYKVSRQFVYSPGVCETGYYDTELLGCGSGPFGEAAVDYRSGPRWRDLTELPGDTDFLEEFVGGQDWFDLHFKLG